MIVITPPAVSRPPTPEALAKAAGERGLARALVTAFLAPAALLGSSLAEMLARRDADPTRGIDWDALRRRLLRVAKPPLASEAEKGAEAIPRQLRRAFDLVPERAAAAAEAQAGDLVTGITEEARAALRSVIARSQREGRSVDATAAEVRQVLGLNRRYAQAVANRRRVLEAENVGSTRVDSLVAAYRDRLADVQARTIARTELLRASNLGAMEGYRQAVAAGALAPDFLREWVTAREDGRLCPICRPLNGVQVVGLESTFTTITGAILTPPSHPNCRCRLVARPPARRLVAA